MLTRLPVLPTTRPRQPPTSELDPKRKSGRSVQCGQGGPERA